MTDTGVAGVTVTAYDMNGNAVGKQSTSSASGFYTITPSVGEQCVWSSAPCQRLRAFAQRHAEWHECSVY